MADVPLGSVDLPGDRAGRVEHHDARAHRVDHVDVVGGVELEGHRKGLQGRGPGLQLEGAEAAPFGSTRKTFRAFPSRTRRFPFESSWRRRG